MPQQLQSLTYQPTLTPPNTFPFNLSIVQNLDMHFTQNVTFFVGENGSGKSTLLETIACGAHLPTVGSYNVDNDPTLVHARQLAQALRWNWSIKKHRGFFMRSEDFFGYAKRMSETRAELERERQEIIAEYERKGRNKKAIGLATMPFSSEIHAIHHAYGEGLDAQSHGESYFKLFQTRFVPNGLYLLDEPEAPLSPTRQLSFITMIYEMVKQGAQFIIATHSPILLAYPHATILSFDGGKIQPCAYDELEHVTVTRTFLNNPDSYLRHLLSDE